MDSIQWNDVTRKHSWSWSGFQNENDNFCRRINHLQNTSSKSYFLDLLSRSEEEEEDSSLLLDPDNLELDAFWSDPAEERPALDGLCASELFDLWSEGDFRSEL